MVVARAASVVVVVAVSSPEVTVPVVEGTSVEIVAKEVSVKAVPVTVVTEEGLHGPAWTPAARPISAIRTFWAIILKECNARKRASNGMTGKMEGTC